MAAPGEALSGGTLSPGALLRAIEVLHRTPDRDLRRAANSWLEQFQQSLEAWQVPAHPQPGPRRRPCLGMQGHPPELPGKPQ